MDTESGFGGADKGTRRNLSGLDSARSTDVRSHFAFIDRTEANGYTRASIAVLSPLRALLAQALLKAVRGAGLIVTGFAPLELSRLCGGCKKLSGDAAIYQRRRENRRH